MNKLKEIREAAGLTQTALACKMGMAGSLVSAVESGARRPWPNFKRKVANALGMPESEIFGDA